MTTARGKAWKLTESSRPLFESIFPDLSPEAKYILIYPEGYLTINEEPDPSVAHIPHFAILSYYHIEYEID